ncbi:RNI-like protein [Thelephora ganbajun]|uniref:RNI-like protein n=1 Tax=Thelephora ganbajun TaxID=370292 RepID=A0ACB6ZN42_THEGA|nr:RNI-like protein [Thelephora ganbajun]
MPHQVYKRPVSPAQSSDSQSDAGDDDPNKSTFFPSIDVAPAQWISKIHLLSSRPPQIQDSPASRLPPEILIHVFKNLHSTKDLHNCLFVSRTWCECSVELIWHKPAISRLHTFIKIMSVISKQDQTFTYARFIRRLNFVSVGKELTSNLFSRLYMCTRLERLTLVGCSAITDEALETVLSACPNLVAIDLTGVIEATDKAITALARTCERLQGINLGGCRAITSEGVFALAKHCYLLRRVKLSYIEAINDEAVSALAQSCPYLLEIDLNGCSYVTDLGVRDLWIHSKYMREMRLAHCVNLTDAAFPSAVKEIVPPSGVNPFAQSSQPPPTASPDDLPPLVLNRSFDHLRMLDLTCCARISDDAIEGIVSNCPKIRNLVVAKCSSLTDAAVESICKLGKHLHYLHLGHITSITDRSVSQLARSCTRLKYIDLANCSLLTDMSVFELAALQKLRRIGLVRVNNLTDQAVYALTPRRATLERLHLSYCNQISVFAINFMLQKLPKLNHLSLTGIDAFRNPEFQQFCRQPPSDFNSTQRAAFCVFSGKGVAELREYLKERYTPFIEADGENDTDYDDDDDEDVSGTVGRSGMPSTNNNTREAGHSSRYHPPMNTGTTANTSSYHSDRTNYVGFTSRRQTNGVHPLQAILGTENSSSSSTQQRQGPGQLPMLGWAHGRTPQLPGSVPGPSTMPNLHINGAGPSSLRGFGQQPLVEPRSPTPGDIPAAGWVSNPTLTHPSQHHLNGHDGSAGGSNGAAFFRTYQDYDNSTTSRHHVMTPELNFAEIGHGRGTSHGADVPRGYGGDDTRDKDTDDEDLVVVDADNHTPLTPPSGYGSTNVVTPTPRRGYSVGDIPQSDGSGTEERQAYFHNPHRHQLERDQGRHQPRPRARRADHGSGSSLPQIRALQESVHQALGGGVVPPDNLSDGSSNGTGGRGRSERKGWRNRLTAAEQYASSILFGRGGNGVGGSGSGTGSSGQVLQERDE